MSNPKTNSELVKKYADIIDSIIRAGTRGSYTWVGVLGSFLNEWIEMNSSEEEDDDDYEPPTEEALKEIDRLRGLLAEGGRGWTAAENPQTPDEFFDSVKEVLKDG